MRKWIGAIANFFFAGLGYVIFGSGTRRLLGVAWTLGAIGLTYVELSVQTAAPALYWPMFASVFLMNTAFAIDGYRTFAAEEKETGTASARAGHASA